MNKKCISPIVATTLLLVVAVITVIGFLGWFNDFQSELQSDINQESNSILTDDLRMDAIVDNNLYIYHSGLENKSIKNLYVNNINCEIKKTELESVDKIDIGTCLRNFEDENVKILIQTNKKTFTKTFYYRGSSFEYVKLEDIRIYESIEFNDKLYFRGDNTSSHYNELYSMDKSGNIELVEKLNPTGNSNPYYFIEYNNKLYFIAYNGSSSNTYSIDKYENIDIILNQSFRYPIIYNNKMYFSSNYNLYSMDESENINQINISVESATNDPKKLFVYNDKLHFIADDLNKGWEFFSLDYDENVNIITDINTVYGPLGCRYCYPDPIPYNNKLYFNVGISGYKFPPGKLYFMDSNNIVEVITDEHIDSLDFIANIKVINNDLYFSLFYDSWKDGNDYSNKLLKLDKNDNMNLIGNPEGSYTHKYFYQDIPDKLFSVYSNTTQKDLYLLNELDQFELIKTNLKTLTPKDVNGALYFPACDDNFCYLYSYSGNTLKIIEKLDNLFPTYSFVGSFYATEFNNKLYYYLDY